jgi:hypothetical protein
MLNVCFKVSLIKFAVTSQILTQTKWNVKMLTGKPKMILCLFVLTEVICFKKIYSPNLNNQQRITAWFFEFTHKGMAQTISKLYNQKLYK